MSVGRAMVVHNPSSGGGASSAKWNRAAYFLDRSGLRYDYSRTEEGLHAQELARQAVQEGYGLVIAVGGDGTINEVVNGLMAADPRPDLGVIDAGSANDFAHSIGLPGDLEVVCRLLAGERRREIDVGVVDAVTAGGEAVRRYFVNVAGAGFDGKYVEEIHKQRSGGLIVYAGTLVRTLATYRARNFFACFDQERVMWRALTVLVCNGRHIAATAINPDADMSDGQFEVMAIDLPKMLGAIPTYLGLPAGLVSAGYWRGKQIRLESDEPLPVEADGELVGEVPAEFWIMPRALRIVA